MTLGIALRATKGQAAPEVERLYTRARELCEQVGEPSQLFRVLWGFCHVHALRGEYQTRRALGAQLLSLAQRLQDPDLSARGASHAVDHLTRWRRVGRRPASSGTGHEPL